MKFRTRLVLTLSTATAITVTAAFTTASYAVQRSEERQLDEALRVEARQEAAEISSAKDARLHITDRGGPRADDVGRLTKYAVIYDGQGSVVDHTPTFTMGIPELVDIRHPRTVAFDFDYGGEKLRGMFVKIPGLPEHRLFLAASLHDLQRDVAFLREVMLLAALLSVASTVFAIWRVVSRLTRGHEAIGLAARRVAAGDLSTRIALDHGDDEVMQLARDIDEMVRRLELVVEGQARFIAHAAHELRSPLTALYGELQLALRRSRTPEEYRACIEEALDAARRLKLLAEDLLALARFGAERPASHGPVRLADVARTATASVARDAERLQVKLDVVTDEATVLGHAMGLERMVRNLLENAIRHSPLGGTVRLSVTCAEGQVVVSVADEGAGVPEGDRARIFEPFFRGGSTERAPGDGGSGLGLAIVREIARAHRGDVSVECDASGGTTFRAHLEAVVDDGREPVLGAEAREISARRA